MCKCNLFQICECIWFKIYSSWIQYLIFLARSFLVQVCIFVCLYIYKCIYICACTVDSFVAPSLPSQRRDQSVAGVATLCSSSYSAIANIDLSPCTYVCMYLDKRHNMYDAMYTYISVQWYVAYIPPTLVQYTVYDL